MRLFLDLLPGTDPAVVAAARDAGAELVRERGPEWVTVQEPADLDDLPRGASLWLVGAEAGGAVGSVGVLTLIRAAVATGRPWVATGLGPLGSAAAVALGAAGVVVESGAWLVEGSPVGPAHRTALERARSGRDTEVVEGARRLRGSGEPADQWWLDPDAAIPASQCVAAQWREGTVQDLISAVRQGIEAHRSMIAEHHPLREGADPFGCGLPLVQGPMANIAERADLAVAVTQAGAMPFAALGALDADQARAVLDDFAARLDGRPWGVGVIGFEMMPHRDAHLDAIESMVRVGRGPAAVTLAGGSPALALELQERGLSPWLHTPSGALLQRAARRGVGTVILEGRDAGGHVGALTSVGLWEEGLAASRESQGLTVVLAGGISDPITAAFAAAMAAPACASGVTVALQAGTAFLFTHEVAESDQLAAAAQQAGLATRETVLVGATVNLALRCVPNPYTREAQDLEAGWLGDALPLSERRARMEAHNLGRTRLAAKGIERNPEWPDKGPRYRAVSTARQRTEGAISLGEGAVLTDRLEPVADVVEALTSKARALLAREAPTSTRWSEPARVGGGPRAERIPAVGRVQLGGHGPAPETDGAIAIVGLGCVLPGAPDVDAFWSNLLAGFDAIGAVPEERWPAHRYFDPHKGAGGPALSAARHAGVVGELAFDPLRYRIPPASLPTVDPAQRMALIAADQAVTDAGWIRPDFDRSRAAVLLGNSMGGEHAKSLALRVRFREVLAILEDEGALDALPAEARDRWFARVESRLDDALPPIAVDSMTGLLANVIAGRVASWLDWMGGNLTVDAACASSLASVAMAVDWLRSGRCDAVLAGGVDADLSPETYVGFSRTHALSTTGSSPFSTDADGFVMGEGAAVLALMRLSDARARNEPVYAVIRGVGQSSDGRGRGLTAPRPTGQRLAIQRAWADAAIDPARTALIEAHGTGTPVGDATEASVLTDWLPGGAAPVWLGSVKSMIGHLKGGAGAAGLLKTTLALAAGVAPPTLHGSPTNPALHRSRLALPRRPVALPEDAAAGVSAFGFGGTNFHVVLEGAEGQPARVDAWRRQAAPLLVDAHRAPWPTEGRPPLVLAYGAATPEGLVDAVRADRPTTPELAAQQPERCVVVCDPTDRRATVQRIARWLPTAQPRDALGATAFRGHGPPVNPVYLVPGQGAQRPGLAEAPGLLPGGAQFLAAHPVPTTLDASPLTLHRTLVPLALAWGAVLDLAGLQPAALLGHSLGELGALGVAGALSPADALSLAEARGAALQDCPEGAMLAADLPLDQATALAADHAVSVAAHNGASALVLAGDVAAIEALANHLGSEGVRHTQLAVQRAFHTAAMEPAAAALSRAVGSVDTVRSAPPVWSCATGSPATDPLQALVAGLTQPVQFHRAATALVDAGHALFVELGPGATLSRLVDRPGLRTIPLDPTPGDDGLGLVRAAAALLAEGHPGLLALVPGTHRVLALPAPAVAPVRRPQREGAGAIDVLEDTPAPPVQRNAPSSKPPAPVRETDPVRAAVIEAVCDVSGYPPDFLTGDAELEAELGVDSIRKLEILGRLEDALGFRVPESEYRVLERADIDTLTTFVRERLDRQETAEPAIAPAADGVLLYALGPGAGQPVSPREPLDPGLTRKGSRLILKVPPEDSASIPERVRVSLTAITQAIFDDPPAVLHVITPVDSPAGRAAAAFARSAAKERDLTVRVVLDAGADPGVAEAALALDGETWWVAADRAHPWEPQPLEPQAPDRPKPVLWCTGGLAGILGAVLEALAPLEPTVVVLGRTDPDGEGPRAADHRRARKQLADRGVSVRWVRCDLTDPASVPTAVRAALGASGPPDLVLHAAGRTADGPLESSDLDAVLGPKVDGLARLQQFLPDARWLLFSSVAATGGNAHQTGYAAANGALHGWPLRGTAVALSAWSDRGMAADPALLRLLERRGLTPIAPEAGGQAMARLVRGALADALPREVLLLGQAVDSRLPWPLGAWRHQSADHGEFRVPLDPTDPALDHHRVTGRCLVPGALWARALLAAAQVFRPRALAWTLSDFAIEAPTFVDRARTDLTVHLFRQQQGLSATVQSGDTVVARGQLAPTATPPQPPPEWAAPIHPAPYDGPDSPLFHGPHWQVLDRVHLAADHASATVRLSPADSVAAVIEAAHQLLSVWSGRETGQLGLPVGADRWTLHRAPPTGPVRLQLCTTALPQGAEARVLATGPDSPEPFLTGEGVRLRHALRWSEPVDA